MRPASRRSPGPGHSGRTTNRSSTGSSPVSRTGRAPGHRGPDESAERRQERSNTRRSSATIIDAQRTAVIELRDGGDINDVTLRDIERELDLEELRAEG